MRLCVVFALLTANAGRLWGQNMTAECRRPDPNDEKQVYACMSSLRYGRGLADGRNVFEGSGASASCVGLSHDYGEALIKSGVPRSEIMGLLPSCATLAKAMEGITGKPPYWAGCLNYPGHFDAAHMKTCLSTFLPAYSTGKSLQSLNGCADATRTYEYALGTATRIDEGRHMVQRVPPGYEKPDCAAVAQLLGGTGGECLNYQPNAAHVSACLGPAATQFLACVPLRQAYEQKLREAYGGQFPPNYAMLTCDQLAGLTGAATGKQEEIRRTRRAQAEAFRQREAARSSDAAASRDAEGGFFGTLFRRWLGWPFFAALFFHAALSIAALLYARQQIMTGRWDVFQNTVGSVLAGYMFRWQMLGAHALLLAVGWWLTRWPWAVGALLVIPVSRVALLIMMGLGLLRVPRRRAGPVGGVSMGAPQMTDGKKDDSISNDWDR